MDTEFSYAKSLSEIEHIIRQIEAKEIDVDQLSEKVKRLSNLIKACKAKLYKTEEEVRDIIEDLVE